MLPGDVAASVGRAGLRGKRLALGLTLAVSFAFVGVSVFEIIPAVFGARVRPLPVSPPGSPAQECADGVRRLSAQAEWAGAAHVQQACAQSYEGLDAWASLRRLQRAQQQLGSTTADDLDPLRRDVAAHLPPDPR